MERFRNSRGIPLTFKYLITIIILSECKKDAFRRSIEKSHDGDSRFTSRKPKRAGDDGSPVLFRERKITPELEAEPRKRYCFWKVSVPGDSAVKGNSYVSMQQ